MVIFLIASAVVNTQFVMEFVYFNFKEFYCDGTIFLCLKNFGVDDLLRGKSTRSFDGAGLVERLKAGILYSKEERSFLTKTVCRFLMAHCQT